MVDVDGESLLELVGTENHGENNASPRKAYSETIFESIGYDNPEEVEIISCYASLRDYPWKLIWNRLDNTYELYKIDNDRHERHNKINDNVDIMKSLSFELRELAEDIPTNVRTSDDDLLIKRLEELGYL
jgi:hypothetical protein